MGKLSLLLVFLAGCGSSSSSGGFVPQTAVAPATSSAPMPTAPIATTTTSPPAPTAPNFDALAAAAKKRARDYLEWCVAPTTPGGEGLETQVARLELGRGPLDRRVIEDSLAHVEQRRDTADFHANGLVRILSYNSALLAADLRDRAERALLGFRYALEDPSRGEELCLWSENHQVLFATAELIAGTRWPQATFANTGWTGARHAARAKGRVLRWLDHRMRFGFSEWNSPVYYVYDVMPLANLVDFAPDAEVRERAALVLDLLVFDLARLTHRGSFSPSSGRAYEEHKLSGRGQSIGDAIEVLFGTRGSFRGRNNPAAIFLACSRYRVPHVLLAIGVDRDARFLDRSRSGISLAEGPSQGIGYATTEDGLFWWGMGAYTAKETIVLSRRMIQAHGLESYPAFKQVFGPLKLVPDALLPALADTLSPLAEGSILSTANVATWRTRDAMLSSVQSYRKGQVGFQQHAWQATLDLDAVVFTTAPGTFGHDGPTAWTGSGSMPRVVQVEDALLVLYDPTLASRALFPQITHAWFPKGAFDEVAQQGRWVFGRKGEGYLALWSALPTSWATGTFAGKELVAQGARNAWVCQVGSRGEDGSFADFMKRVATRVEAKGAGNDLPGTPLSVLYEAPGLGRLELSWSGPALRNGAPIVEGGFPRHENPYARVPWGARRMKIEHGGAELELDLDRGTRLGRGL